MVRALLLIIEKLFIALNYSLCHKQNTYLNASRKSKSYFLAGGKINETWAIDWCKNVKINKGKIIFVVKVLPIKFCGELFLLKSTYLNPKRPRLLGGVLFREMKFVLWFFFKWRSKYFIWKLRCSANFWHLGQCF